MHKHTISFRNAFIGIWTAVMTQVNLRVHFILGSLALLLAVYFQISIVEIIVLVLTIMIVMLAEMVNTALESLADAVTLEKNDYIKTAKDVAAGAVLLSAIFALIIGCMIFGPKVYDFVRNFSATI